MLRKIVELSPERVRRVRGLRLLCALAALAGVSGRISSRLHAGPPPSPESSVVFTTEIVSVPPGARIEVDGQHVGTAPLRYAWRGPAYTRGHFGDRDHTIAAFPTGPGQRPVVRGFPGGDARGGRLPSRIPERVVLELFEVTTLSGSPPKPVAAELDLVRVPGDGYAFPRPAARLEAQVLARATMAIDPSRVERVEISAPELGLRATPPGAGDLVPPEGVALALRESAPVPSLPGRGSAGDLSMVRGAPPPASAGRGARGAGASLSLPRDPGPLAVFAVTLAVLLLGAAGKSAARRWARDGMALDEEPPRPRSSGQPRSVLELRRLYAAQCACLGLPPEAPFRAVKRRYRELALRCHPDKTHSAEGEEQFKRISHAYANLERLSRALTGMAEDSPTSGARSARA